MPIQRDTTEIARLGRHAREVVNHGRSGAPAPGWDLAGRPSKAAAAGLVADSETAALALSTIRRTPSTQLVALSFQARYNIPACRATASKALPAIDGLALRMRDEPLLDCCGDRETCMMCYFCAHASFLLPLHTHRWLIVSMPASCVVCCPPATSGPCVLVAQTARFTGHTGWIYGSLWCCMPPCVGAFLRQRIFHFIGETPPPNFLWALVVNHILCMPCSMCQEARIAKGAAKQVVNVIER